MDNNKGWFVVIAIVVIIGVVALAMVWLIYDSFQRTVTPVQSMTGDHTSL